MGKKENPIFVFCVFMLNCEPFQKGHTKFLYEYCARSLKGTTEFVSVFCEPIREDVFSLVL